MDLRCPERPANRQVGMTLADLINVFTTEGGLSTTSQRTYVYRQCPYIKVDVKFAASRRDEELPSDKITAVSLRGRLWIEDYLS
jgi:hypothetical protein